MTKNIILLCLFLTVCKKIKKGVAICKRMCYNVRGQEKWPISQTAKTSPSHGEDMGSIPVWVTNLFLQDSDRNGYARHSLILLAPLLSEAEGSPPFY